MKHTVLIALLACTSTPHADTLRAPATLPVQGTIRMNATPVPLVPLSASPPPSESATLTGKALPERATTAPAALRPDDAQKIHYAGPPRRAAGPAAPQGRRPRTPARPGRNAAGRTPPCLHHAGHQSAELPHRENAARPRRRSRRPAEFSGRHELPGNRAGQVARAMTISGGHCMASSMRSITPYQL